MKSKKKAILITCFDWYNNRIVYVDYILKKNGYETLIVYSDFNHIKKKIDKSLSNIDNMEYVHVKQYKKNISINRLVSHYGFAKNIRKLIIREKPELVYCLVPPNLLVQKIASQKKQLDFKLYFDIIDLWPESFPIGYTNLFPLRCWRNIRDKYLNNADIVVVECEAYKAQLNKIIPEEKFRTFRLIKKSINCDVMTVNLPQNIIVLAYLGSINNLIDINEICRIIKILLRIKPVLLKVIGDGEKREELLKRVKSIGAEVNYFGKVYDDIEKMKIFHDCHFGLNIYNTNTAIGLTLKSIDYFQIGLPILNSISGDTKQLVEDNSVGLNVSDINENNIIKAVDNIATLKSNVRKMFDANFNENNIENILSFLYK